MPFTMALNISILSVISLTFLAMTNVVLALPRDLPSYPTSLPELVQEPKAKYYMTKKSSVMIECQARGAAEITFTCGGKQIPPSSVENIEPDATRPDEAEISTAFIKLTRADLKHGKKKMRKNEEFWCECTAEDEEGNRSKTSRRAYISMAQMTKKFMRSPVNTAAIEGDTARFYCEPPRSNPKPEIIWKRNGKRLNVAAIPNMSIDSDGTLVITDVKMEDASFYQCVAKNVAGRRETERADLQVSVKAPTTTTTTASPKEAAMTFPYPIPDIAEFLLDLEPQYKLSPTDTVDLVCSIVSAKRLMFNCNNGRIDRTLVKEEIKTDPASGKTIIYSTYTINAAEIEQERYSCQCSGWYLDEANSWKNVLGQRARLIVSDDSGEAKPFIESQFVADPRSASYNTGVELFLTCQAPAGNPVPTVYWMKDNRRINLNSDGRIYFDEGELIIDPTRTSDSGSYFCVAENSAGRRRSRPAQVTVEDGGQDGGSHGLDGGQPTCMDQISECMTSLAPTNDSDMTVVQICKKSKCLDELITNCGHMENVMSMLMNAKKRFDDQCQMLNTPPQACPPMQECFQRLSIEPQQFTSWQILMSFGQLCSVSSVSDERRTIFETFANCMNNALENCGSQIADSPSDTAISNVLSNMCDSFEGLESCEDIDACQVHWNPLQGENGQLYWCRSFSDMMDCVGYVNDMPESECARKHDFKSEIAMVSSTIRSASCPATDTTDSYAYSTPEPETEPETEPEVFGTDESTAVSEPEPETTSMTKDEDESTTEPDVNQDNMVPEHVDQVDAEPSSEPNMEVTEEMIAPAHVDHVDAEPTAEADGVTSEGDAGMAMETSSMDMGGAEQTSQMMPKEDEGMPKEDEDMSKDEEPTTQSQPEQPEEPETAETKGGNGGSVISTSILLTTCLQLIVATLLFSR